MEGPQNQRSSQASDQPQVPPMQVNPQPIGNVQAQARGMPQNPRPFYPPRGPFPQQFAQGFPMMAPPMGMMMTPQQQQEQYQAMQQKFAIKSSLTDQCSKHESFNVIFEDSENKYCEKCIQEKEEKNKDDHHEADEDLKQKQVVKLLEELKKEDKSSSQPVNKQQKIQDLQTQLQSLLNNLSLKMQKKVVDLNMRHQQLSIYESTLSEKFRPVFQEMKQTIQERQLDYMTYLLKQLNQNKDRVQVEKVTLDKLMNSFYKVGEDVQHNLESQLKNIELQDKEAEKLIQQEQEIGTIDSENDDKADKENEKPKINTYQIESLSTMLDDFENIITKNYCVYTNYEDFSFAKSRSKQQLESQFKEFVKTNFSGYYQLQNWFHQEVLPRMYFLQHGTKFIYTYKILHYNSECQLIQNRFTFPDKGRSITTPEGHLYFIGGYYNAINLFSNNTFILDEHRSTLVALQRMNTGRADHGVLYFKNNIYVFGGMNFKEGSNQIPKSLNSCEQYSIQEDKWTELPPFNIARQGFSVCQFNDKYFFIIGGKTLKEGSTLQAQKYDFVNEIEVFEIDRNQWKSINYISEKNQLKILYPGLFQITGKKIMIFGGAVPLQDEEDKNQIIDCGQKVSLTNQTLYFNVTNGEIKRGERELSKPTYFISGGNIFPQQDKIHALGFGLNKDPVNISHLQEGGQLISEINQNTNKKILHSYKISDNEWTETHEGIFLGQRKRSLETLDEAI